MSDLEFHHSIEERHIFPVLAQRMPEFNHKSSAVHLEEHKAIHEGMSMLDMSSRSLLGPRSLGSFLTRRSLTGMDRYSAYLSKCKSSPSSFDAEEFRKILQSWGPILFYHLDAEVKTLHHDNLRRCEFGPRSLPAGADFFLRRLHHRGGQALTYVDCAP